MDIWVVSTFFTIMNNAIMNMACKFLCACMFSFFLGIYLETDSTGPVIDSLMTYQTVFQSS